MRIHNISILILALAALTFALGCGESRESVVIYTAHDRNFSEPILDQYEERANVDVKPKFDTEATKTIGLVEALRAEKDNPRADVWWNNEILNTIRLKKEGLLAPVQPPTPPNMPETFRDPDGYWYGFGARARILIVNTDLVPEGDRPDSIYDLADPKWKGKVGIAKPLFGTTASHAAVLFAELGADGATAYFDSLKANDIQIEAGNRQVAAKVANGLLAFGLTDTDDARLELDAGAPVTIVFPDQGTDQMGALLIPNTVARIKGGPNPLAASGLVGHLLSPEVETALAQGPAAQIPLNPNVAARPDLPGVENVQFMEVDFEAAADAFDEAKKVIETRFLR